MQSITSNELKLDPYIHRDNNVTQTLYFLAINDLWWYMLWEYRKWSEKEKDNLANNSSSYNLLYKP